MVTQDAASTATDTSGASTGDPSTATQGTGAQNAERTVQIVRVSPEGAATLWGAVLGALGRRHDLAGEPAPDQLGMQQATAS